VVVRLGGVAVDRRERGPVGERVEALPAEECGGGVDHDDDQQDDDHKEPDEEDRRLALLAAAAAHRSSR
jgi:hypothetical protein